MGTCGAVSRLFTPEIAAFYEDVYTRKGVEFKKGRVISGFERDEQGKVITLDSEENSFKFSDCQNGLLWHPQVPQKI